jgi:hypothetical protein
MGEKANQTSGVSRIQVFELTMDNYEDQDELNRRLQKPGEPSIGPTTANGRTMQSESEPES